MFEKPLIGLIYLPLCHVLVVGAYHTLCMIKQRDSDPLFRFIDIVTRVYCFGDKQLIIK